MPTPLQRSDITALCARKSITLDELASHLLYDQLHGVPLDQLPTMNRAWRLVSEMVDERIAKHLAENYTLLATCPCGGATHTTGGKHPLTYCAKCDSIRSEHRHYRGQDYYYWAHPSV